ncbi:uncharacterized protein LOC115067406 [Nannospalax galili]|uniref:uncharacterized protein LOC115067406 n=1 Tax=Nannospalax galili TaxID=1026970 RepID=UPI00111C67FC|nr:uncharacterized protein LOC115067406 [Nannospalax galili]
MSLFTLNRTSSSVRGGTVPWGRSGRPGPRVSKQRPVRVVSGWRGAGLLTQAWGVLRGLGGRRQFLQRMGPSVASGGLPGAAPRLGPARGRRLCRRLSAGASRLPGGSRGAPVQLGQQVQSYVQGTGQQEHHEDEHAKPAHQDHLHGRAGQRDREGSGHALHQRPSAWQQAGNHWRVKVHSACKQLPPRGLSPDTDDMEGIRHQSTGSPGHHLGGGQRPSLVELVALVAGDAGAGEGLLGDGHTHWGCRVAAPLSIPAGARRVQSAAGPARGHVGCWAGDRAVVPRGAGRCQAAAGRLGCRQGAHEGARGAVAGPGRCSGPTRSAAPARQSSRYPELGRLISERGGAAPRVSARRLAELRPREARPARRSLVRSLALSPPLGRAPRCRRASYTVSSEPRRPGREPAGSAGSGPGPPVSRPVASLPGAPRAASCSLRAPPQRVVARKPAKSHPGARGASARPDEFPSRPSPCTSVPAAG